MKFSPCIEKCTYDGTHCQGCGRSHEEIAETKKLVAAIVNFAQEHEYENPEEFLAAITKSSLKRLKRFS